MPTFIRTLKQFAAAQNEPLHKVSEQVETFDTGGQALGGEPVPRAFERGATGTPPRQNSKSTDLDKTPPAEAKVLPWVERVETGTIPDGMFGPYDSVPPSRMPTLHEAPVPEPRGRIHHPFAYTASATIPFAAVGHEHETYDHGPAPPVKDGRERESEVMSRGAGLKSMYQAALGTFGGGKLGSSRTEGGGSPEHGNEHRSPRKAATSRGGSPVKSAPIRPVTTHYPPTDPLPPTPQARTAASGMGRKPAPVDEPHHHDSHNQPHLHRPHHDFPFSHHEAAQKQAAAVQQAHAEALARLEAVRGDVPDLPPSGPKGPRATYNTQTSGPSFGHIDHQDGHPTSARQSYQLPMGVGSAPMVRENAQSGGAFYRIPFGVPMTANLPRPMVLMRTGTGVGMGLGIGSIGLGMQGARLEEVPEVSEASRKRDDRSAFVETVEDEQEPKTPTLKVRNQSLPSQTASQAEPAPARTESELNPIRMSQQTIRNPYEAQTYAIDPEQYPPHMAQQREAHHRSRAPTHASKAPTQTARSARSHHHQPSQDHTSRTNRDGTENDKPAPSAQHHHAPTERTHGAHTVASDHRTFGGKTPSPEHHGHHHPPAPASIAPTSASNVKKIVKDSSFHDETLCELLEAARLNLIGPEAKKALQRAARARVIELKDIKEKGDASAAYPTVPAGYPTPPSSGEKRSKSQAKQSKQPTTPAVEEYAAMPVKDESIPPKWAQTLTDQMAELDARFAQLAEQQFQAELRKATTHMSPDAMHDETDTIPQDLINDLIFHGLPTSAFTADIAGFYPMGPPVHAGATYEYAPSAKIRTITPSHKARENSGDVTLTWGSEVEMPSGASPPKPRQPLGPTINVQPPTESNARTRLASIPSRTDPRTPVRTEIDLIEEQIIPGSGMAEKSLPDTPDAREHSVRSTAPSPEMARGTGAGAAADYFSNDQYQSRPTQSGSSTPVQQHAPRPATTYAKSAANGNGETNGLSHRSQHPTEPSAITQDAVTAPTHFTRHPEKHGKDIIHVKEAVEVVPELGPWDHVTQQLYTWALVWEDDSFTKALEGLALGRQVEMMPLTVFSMMTFKRLLNRNLTAVPPKACDKLFVPPLMAEAINKAVHNKQIDSARQILEDLWYPFGFQTPPRVIIALAKHRNEAEKWTAHRFDLSTGHLTSYGVTSEPQNLPDGRPFMWWHPIRAAWPEYHIPDPEQLKQRVEWVITPVEERNDNSLKALNYARNLLLGFRPELARDLGKLRETVWEERLLHKKKSGHLVVHVDRDSHDHEV